MRLPARLLHRKPDTHKGDYGHVLILAGSGRYIGAACLCAESAMRAGAGRVTLGIPRGIYSIVASRVASEVMTLPLPETKSRSLGSAALRQIKNFAKDVDCVLVGPGLSADPDTGHLVRALVGTVAKPLIIDADGLNAISDHVNVLKKNGPEIILTPHPKEMARLCGVSVDMIQAQRKNIAKKFALRYNITLILKGSSTVVSSKAGRVYENPTGNAGMATAGSGDVLSGIVAAFVAQGLEAFEASCSAVYIHGLSGDLAAVDKSQISLIASDIIEYLPKAFKKFC